MHMKKKRRGRLTHFEGFPLQLSPKESWHNWATVTLLLLRQLWFQYQKWFKGADLQKKKKLSLFTHPCGSKPKKLFFYEAKVFFVTYTHLIHWQIEVVYKTYFVLFKVFWSYSMLFKKTNCRQNTKIKYHYYSYIVFSFSVSQITESVISYSRMNQSDLGTNCLDYQWIKIYITNTVSSILIVLLQKI